MIEIIRAYLITLVIMLIAIACLVYGWLTDNANIYCAGALVFLPLFTICYQTYKEIYYE